MKGPYTNGATLNIGWDLTTQKQTTLVTLANKSVVASGRYKNGYLIAVDSLWLASDADAASTNDDYTICIVMECTLENATQASSTALALSQQ